LNILDYLPDLMIFFKTTKLNGAMTNDQPGEAVSKCSILFEIKEGDPPEAD